MGGLISLAGDESKTSSAGRLMTMLPSMPAMPASRALVHTSLASGPPWLVPAMVDHQRAMGQGRSSGPDGPAEEWPTASTGLVPDGWCDENRVAGHRVPGSP
jgi:hypothetical protein